MVATFGGIFWWLHFGAELVMTNPRLNAFLDAHRGHGFFSFDSLILYLVVACVLLYPPIIWFWTCMTALVPSFARETIFNRSSLAAWFAPITLALFVSFLLLIKILVTLAGWLLLSGSILLLVWATAYSLWEKVLGQRPKVGATASAALNQPPSTGR